METERLIELVTKAQHGDDNSMQTLYLDTYKSVYRFALRMVKNPEDAEDITQEVFITVHEKISGLREPGAFYKWVNQITSSKCIDLLRKYKGIAKLDDDDEILALADDDPINMPDKAIDDEDTRRIIMGVVDNLPDAQRVCILLYYYQQNTIAQIAEVMEINENTVKSRLSLARAKIRAALEEKEKKEGIKLYGIPLALTPILRQVMEQVTVPDGVAERIWDNISQAISEGVPTNTGPGTSGQNVPKSGAVEAAGQSATSAGMTLTTKIIIGIVAAAVVTMGAFLLPRLMNTTPVETSPPAVSDRETSTPVETQQPEDETLAIELDVILTAEQLAFLEPLEDALFDYDLRAAFPYLSDAIFAEICQALPKEFENTYKVDERGEWQLAYFQYDSADNADYRICLTTDRSDGQSFLADSRKNDGRITGVFMGTRDITNGRWGDTLYNDVTLNMLLTEEKLAYMKMIEDAMLSFDIEAAHLVLGSPEFKDFYLSLSEEYNLSGIYKNDEAGEWSIRSHRTYTGIGSGETGEPTLCDINFSITLVTDNKSGNVHRIETSWSLPYNFSDATGYETQPFSFYIQTKEIVDGNYSNEPTAFVSKDLQPSGEWVMSYE